MGRGPLDEEAIKTLEAGNPDVEFDWTRILKGQPAPEVKGADRRDPARRERRGQNRGRERRAPAVPADTVGPPFRSGADDTSAVLGNVEPDERTMEAPPTPAHARLGSEGVARLRARYSEMLARIDERAPEPERQAELKSLAERLNPDGWVTDADVSAGLESYEPTFAELRTNLRLGPGKGREGSV